MVYVTLPTPPKLRFVVSPSVDVRALMELLTARAAERMRRTCTQRSTARHSAGTSGKQGMEVSYTEGCSHCYHAVTACNFIKPNVDVMMVLDLCVSGLL